MFITGCAPEDQYKPEIVGTVRGPRPIYNTDPIPTPVPPKPTPTPTRTSSTRLDGKVIIVDPGHGGRDPGAGEVGYSKAPEKTINLAVAKDVAMHLKEAGAKVVMTRTGDTFVKLENRAAAADRYRVDLLVSIHANSFPDSRTNGASLYVAKRSSSTSRKVARGISSAFTSAGIKSNGTLKEDFKVLALHSRPAVLVECGYLTNRIEARNLNTNWYRKKVARRIAEGIKNSLR